LTSDMRANWETRQLALAFARIADAGQWIGRQQQLIEELEELEAAGRSTEAAEKILAVMVTILTSMRDTGATIQRLLSRSSIH
jgi:hypothetical protein